MANLYIIPARGGSKGIPGKNIKPLNGRPLIFYSLDVAKSVASKNDIICISTDDDAIIKAVKDYGFEVDFKRPESLATDTAGTYEVLLHALSYYEEKGFKIDKVILLQPTSPFRKANHVVEALKYFSNDLDMVASVKVTKSNPYFNLVEENEDGFLFKSKNGNYIRRQDCPPVYEYNGAVYIINPDSLKENPLHEFKKVKKYLMDEVFSIDLDTPFDWLKAEFFLNNYYDLIS